MSPKKKLELVRGEHVLPLFLKEMKKPSITAIKAEADKRGYIRHNFEIAVLDYNDGDWLRSKYRHPRCKLPPHDSTFDMVKARIRRERQEIEAAEPPATNNPERKGNPDRISAAAFAKSAGFTLAGLMVEQGAICPCCKIDLIALGYYHLDHIMPLALGGVNEYWNAQFLCPSCNFSKNAKNPYSWAKSTGAKLPQKFLDYMAERPV